MHQLPGETDALGSAAFVCGDEPFLGEQRHLGVARDQAFTVDGTESGGEVFPNALTALSGGDLVA